MLITLLIYSCDLLILTYTALIVFGNLFYKEEIELSDLYEKRLADQKIYYESLLIVKDANITEIKNSYDGRINELYSDIGSLTTKLDDAEEIFKTHYTSQLQQWKITEEQRIRQSALNTSRSVLRGHITELFAPYLSEFPIENVVASDFRFFGNPVDFVLFHNMSNVRDNKSKEDIVVYFIDIKTGKSRLTPVQNRIKKAIENKQVEWITFNMP